MSPDHLRQRQSAGDPVDHPRATTATVRRLGLSNFLHHPNYNARPPGGESLRLHELGRVAAPGIDRLGVLYAVRTRQASDALADWRDELSQALESAHRVREHHVPADEINAAVRDHVAHARVELQREAKKSKLLNGLNPISVVVDALGGTVAGSTGGMAGTTVGAVGGTIGPWVQAILNSRKLTGYLDRHYLVFEPTSASG